MQNFYVGSVPGPMFLNNAGLAMWHLGGDGKQRIYFKLLETELINQAKKLKVKDYRILEDFV